MAKIVKNVFYLTYKCFWTRLHTKNTTRHVELYLKLFFTYIFEILYSNIFAFCEGEIISLLFGIYCKISFFAAICRHIQIKNEKMLSIQAFKWCPYSLLLGT